MTIYVVNIAKGQYCTTNKLPCFDTGIFNYKKLRTFIKSVQYKDKQYDIILYSNPLTKYINNKKLTTEQT